LPPYSAYSTLLDTRGARSYPKAVEILRARLKGQRRNVPLRQQLADLLVLDGKAREAILQATKEMRLRTFEPGDIIVAEGEPGGSLYVVTTGALKAFVRNGTGRMVPVRVLSDGCFFGEISLLSGGKRTALSSRSTRASVKLFSVCSRRESSRGSRRTHLLVVVSTGSVE